MGRPPGDSRLAMRRRSGRAMRAMRESPLTTASRRDWPLLSGREKMATPAGKWQGAMPGRISHFPCAGLAQQGGGAIGRKPFSVRTPCWRVRRLEWQGVQDMAGIHVEDIQVWNVAVGDGGAAAIRGKRKAHEASRLLRKLPGAGGVPVPGRPDHGLKSPGPCGQPAVIGTGREARPGTFVRSQKDSATFRAVCFPAVESFIASCKNRSISNRIGYDLLQVRPGMGSDQFSLRQGTLDRPGIR